MDFLKSETDQHLLRLMEWGSVHIVHHIYKFQLNREKKLYYAIAN